MDSRGTQSVLLLNDDLDIGGVQRLVVEIANRLESRGFSVTVAASSGGILWAELDTGIAREFLEKRSGIASRIRNLMIIRRLLRDRRFSVVHVHQRGLSVLVRLARVGVTSKVVEHVHNTFSPGRFGRLVSFRSDHLIACGSAVRSMLVDELGRRPERVSLVGNAVEGPDPDLLAQAANKQSNSPTNAITILGVGRLAEQKNPERFIRVLVELGRLLEATDIQVRGRWVGGGPLRDEVSQQITGLPLEVRIDLIDETTDVGRHFVESDLLMLTSRWEGLPLVVLEAMSFGRGVIAPDVGSCADVVRDGVNGILYGQSLSDVEVAQIIARRLSFENTRDWGAASRREFELRGGLDGLVSEVIEAYQLPSGA